MRITVFGASGRTGIHVVEQAIARGHSVIAFVRSPDKFSFDNQNVDVVVGDAYEGRNVETAVAKGEAVISTLGQSRTSPSDLLTVAGRHIIDAMEVKGVSRLVTLVGAGVRTDNESVSPGGKLLGLLLRLFSRSVLEDAKVHVADVRSSNLQWTVVRVPRLGDGNPRSEYRTGEDLKLGFEAVQRADVADFMVSVVENNNCVGQLPKIGY